MSLLAKLLAEAVTEKRAGAVKCRHCGGAGRVLPFFSANHMEVCPKCGGSGKEPA